MAAAPIGSEAPGDSRRLVVILAVALVLVAAVGVYVFWRMSERITSLKDRLGEAKQETADLRRDQDRIIRIRDKAVAEQRKADERLEAVQADFRSVRESADGLKRQQKETAGRLEKERDLRKHEAERFEGQLRDRAKEIADLKLAQVKLKQELTRRERSESGAAAKLRAAEDNLKTERAAKIRMRDDLTDLKRQVQDRDKQIAALTKQMTLLKAEFASFTELYGPQPDPVEQSAPLIKASVTDIAERDGHTFVTISAGAKQKVAERMKFILYAGDTRTGEVRIIEVRDTSSVGVLTVTTATAAAKGNAATTKRREE